MVEIKNFTMRKTTINNVQRDWEEGLEQVS